MHIANPIYDSVFKYLLDDNRLAKLILSTILGEEIMELDFLPQEYSVSIDKAVPRQFTVYRLDFAATVKNAAGEMRKILIEIQKAKLATDIMRFRRYLGEQYRAPTNTYRHADGTVKPLPLLSIYFLGYPLEHSNAPVIHVRRESRDMTTDEPLKKKEVFIESLTHDSYVIQIPCLRQDRRTDLEKLLYFFDQNNITPEKHTLKISESEVDERYQLILRRLIKATAETEIQAAMDVEDDILNELQVRERETEKAYAQAEKERLAKEEAQVQAEKERSAKEEAQVQAEKERSAKEEAQVQAEKERVAKEEAQVQVAEIQAQADQERLEKERLLALLKQSGIDPQS